MTAMTTTIPAPITLDTACPAWCTRHEQVSDEGEPTQFRHQAQPAVLTYPPDEGGTRDRQITVTPELYVRRDGTTKPVVYFRDQADGLLASSAEVAEVVAALLEAGRLAFGEVKR